MSVRIETQAEPIPGYTLLDRLGAGGFGEVWRCEAPGGIYKAVKIIHGDLRSRDNDLVRYAEQELKALKRVKMVRHPYLLALDRYDIVDGRLMIVMELADCNLWDRFRECRAKGLPGIPRDELLMYMAETAEVLDLMNDQFQLQHLDIKPQNLFLLYHHVKVADFGQVKDLQGIMADVTGGITPVYAAPETFDGKVTRFCDQYSLACVYQELLTGARPFDGCSMSQLLMQHLHLPPNLDPSPPADRPALARALAKGPDDRWPSVSEFVRALRGADPAGRGEPARAVPAAEPRPSPATDTPFPVAFEETDSHQPVCTPAPPEVTGDGPLRPALVIGLGGVGMRVLQRLRFDLDERFGPAANTPVVRTLLVDTDPDAAAEAAAGRPADRLAGLNPDDVLVARLNRASHYLKPRLNGRTLIDGWFDPQLLYKIPRVPQTMGVRLFGRLAFCDHYRAVMGRVAAELEACLSPDALRAAEHRTGLRRRTNRPRVYVVAGLAGGTGGGMVLDVAYAVRARLRRIGYDAPDVVGVLVVPPADAAVTPPQALGNTFAALTELNHYGRPDAVYTASFDERYGLLAEKGPAFTRWYLVPGAAPPPAARPGPASGAVRVPDPRTSGVIGAPLTRTRPPGSAVVAGPGSRPVPPPAGRVPPDPLALKPYADVAELLRLDLLTPVGRAADDARAARQEDAPAGGGVRFAAFGVAGFGWPRAEVVGRTAGRLARAVLRSWVTPNVTRAREVVPGWAAARWTSLGLDPDPLLGQFEAAAEAAAGAKVEELVVLTVEPLVPRGWLARLPEPDKVVVAQDRLVRLFGPPVAGPKRPPTDLEAAVGRAAAAATAAAVADLGVLGPTLVEDPDFRMAGAEEVLRQFLSAAERAQERAAQQAAEADARAQAGFECVAQYAHHQPGMRKPAAGEFADALRQWPRARFQGLLARHLAATYRRVREALCEQLAEVAALRQRLEAVAVPEPGPDRPDPADPRRVMPPGCPTVADAVQRFLGVLTVDDEQELDRRTQAALEPDHGGLVQACVSTARGAEGVVGVLLEEARAYLDARLGDVDLWAMLTDRFRTPQLATRAVEQAFHAADPGWAGGGPWAAAELAVVAAPTGAAGEPVRELVRRSVPVAGLPVVDSRDDLTILREVPGVPLAALPHLGPAGQMAYQTLPDSLQCSLHSRLDVTQWADVDAGG